MRSVWILAIAISSALGCERGEREKKVVLPRVPPDTVVASWSFISRSSDRRSVHSVLEASRELTTTTRSPNGTIMSVSRTISKKEYSTLVDELRVLDCCSLQSSDAERLDPSEAKPLLEIDLGDTRCEIERWDHEWREGVARECALSFVRVHRAGFVPDAPVDDSPP
jgi:hypothetical protein